MSTVPGAACSGHVRAMNWLLKASNQADSKKVYGQRRQRFMYEPFMLRQ